MATLQEMQCLFSIALKESIANRQYNLLGTAEPFGCKPVNINLDVTIQCCLKCQMCDVWKTRYEHELEIPQWIELVKDLKSWLGDFRLTISGGEPFMKRGIWDLFDYSASVNLPTVVITNGFMFEPRKLERLLETRLTQVLISVDSLKPEVHDTIRGVPGSHARIMRAIDFLAPRKRSFVLATNTVISRRNIAEVGQMGRKLAAAGVERMLFQPVQGGFSLEQKSRWPFTSDMWPDSREEIDGGLRDLRAAKDEGTPIVNTAEEIESFREYFLQGEAWVRPWECSVGYSTLQFDPEGNARMCSPSTRHIGNIRDASPRELWSNALAAAERTRIEACRHPCVLNCNRSHRLQEKVVYGWNAVRRRV